MQEPVQSQKNILETKVASIYSTAFVKVFAQCILAVWEWVAQIGINQTKFSNIIFKFKGRRTYHLTCNQ